MVRREAREQAGKVRADEREKTGPADHEDAANLMARAGPEQHHDRSEQEAE